MPSKLVVVVLAVLLAAAAAPVAGGEAGRFVILSDLHLDRFYGTPQAMHDGDAVCGAGSPSFGQTGCDAPDALIASAIAAAANVVGGAPDFVLVAGDVLRHEMAQVAQPNQVRTQTIGRVAQLLNDSFPAIRRVHTPNLVVMAIGNNDVIPDYALNVAPATPQLGEIAHDWRNELTDDELAMISEGGFYNASQLVPGLHVLSINTVIYSPKHTPDTSAQDDPYGQFTWLRATLAAIRAAGERAFILGHIPPAVDSYNHITQWAPKYVETFLDIACEFADTITAHFFAHIHSDEFRALPPRQACPERSDYVSPIFLVGSVTPLFGNNPSFRVVSYAAGSLHLIDFSVFRPKNMAATELEWTLEYSARDYYSFANLSNAVFHDLAVRMDSNTDNALSKFQAVRRAGAPDAPCTTDACRREWSCLLRFPSVADFQNCQSTTTTTTTTTTTKTAPSGQPTTTVGPTIEDPKPAPIAAAVLGGLMALAAVGAIVLFLYRVHQRRKRGFENVEYSRFTAEFDDDEDWDDADMQDDALEFSPARV